MCNDVCMRAEQSIQYTVVFKYKRTVLSNELNGGGRSVFVEHQHEFAVTTIVTRAEQNMTE